MAFKSAEEAYEQIVRALSVAERLRLVERIAHDLCAQSDGVSSDEGYDWRDVAGIAPDLLAGEDAQEWVSRTRRESDERRGKQQKGKA